MNTSTSTSTPTAAAAAAAHGQQPTASTATNTNTNTGKGTGIKLRKGPLLVSAPSPWSRAHLHQDDYISYHRKRERERDAIKARHDLSTYDVLPTGRLVAGSKRAARARSGVFNAEGAGMQSQEQEQKMVDVCFAGTGRDGEGGVGAFVGFGGLNMNVKA
ncbi:hypothetical protein D9615_006734 [Tricholomella constricta]|uniref:Uncharacterized protein n=1 Tax=Tricholomella constricta TaxID=117010 RepID=A0A8H5H6V0_9AGAR|nr:hypothetical protein D9615_006734 [Tricholomella constricta]